LKSPIDIADHQFMERALALAREGIALASPNPCVGALVVDTATGEVLGSGTHTYDGKKHAEILALEQAGERARGKTLYLNLEPCSHQGRTGPCADAVIQAGVQRVVAAMEDPNPQVSGRGLAKLRSVGIEVVVGICEEEARRLNEAFAKYIRTRKPLVILKSAMTLDGKIASGHVNSEPAASAQGGGRLPAAGTTTSWITGEAARAHVQQLRHAADAILVGVGTVLADDPLLTDRTGMPRRRPLLRVILDSHLRLSPQSRLVQTAQEDLLVISSSPDAGKRRELEARGVKVEDLPSGPVAGRPDWECLVKLLGKLEITSLLIEGGATINGAALASGICDKVFFFYAPKVLGSSGAVPFAEGGGFREMSDAISVKGLRLHRLDEDFAVEGYLRDPYDL
jgi:diaminohydroxyphosphoribosylaminopyrimidine deaminase/5-amino-6-(5-phosphoribosylamino)uracil reductase